MYPVQPAKGLTLFLPSTCCTAIDKQYFLQNTFILFFINKRPLKYFGGWDEKDYCVLRTDGVNVIWFSGFGDP